MRLFATARAGGLVAWWPGGRRQTESGLAGWLCFEEVVGRVPPQRRQAQNRPLGLYLGSKRDTV